MLLVLLFNAREEFKVAKEEVKIPTNILKEDDWDLKSFQSPHSTGTNGLKQKRKVAARG